MPKKSGGGGGGGAAKNVASPPEGALVGTSGADLISLDGDILSTDGDDVIWALEGDDSIEAGAGNDVIEAGAGDDLILDGAGDDTVHGGAGSDIIYASAGSDVIDGGSVEGDAETDVVVYFGALGVDYELVTLTETRGNGPNARTEIVGYEVYSLDGSGDMDLITNVDQILFAAPPEEDEIITQSDLGFAPAAGTATLNVLANDEAVGSAPGEGLTLTAILDIQIDIDGDGVMGMGLVPEGVDLTYFASGGLLNDGSILTASADGVVTWDPNGVYDVPPAGDAPGIALWYEVTGDTGLVQYGDVSFQVVYPVASGAVDFETMTGVYDDYTAWLTGLWIYEDGPGGAYRVAQMNSATQFFEERDAGAASYDYDGDGDDEFRVWTEAGGTTHEMNLSRGDAAEFGLDGLSVGGLDAGEVLMLELSTAAGATYASYEITAADLDAAGYYATGGLTGIGQLNLSMSAGGEAWVDDLIVV